jgi:2-amino-4-hydroxy-6-hydroxymethyldihydropteridine diphosphokinase
LPGTLVAESPIIDSAPVGPSQRRYANAVAIIETRLAPSVLLAALKAIEHDLGRRRGQRWAARVLDLDILLWSGGLWASPGLSVPHPALSQRRFVLGPLTQIAPRWRDPLTGLCMSHLKARLDRPRPRD